jgi:hypothetical protein
MAFKSSLKLDSPLFSAEKRKAAGGRAVYKSAREFAQSTQNKMETGAHTGKIVTKARGENFRVRHQQSRRGQRPAPFSKRLLLSVRAKRLSQTESTVEVGADYAEHLQFNLGRKIVTPGDLKEAKKNLDNNLVEEFRKLTK